MARLSWPGWLDKYFVDVPNNVTKPNRLYFDKCIVLGKKLEIFSVEGAVI